MTGPTAPNDGSGPQPPSRSRVTDHDRARLRRTWQVVAAGPALGALAAAAIGLAGGSGQAGLVVVFVFAAAGAAAAALVTALHALVDEYRRQPVARRRPLVAVGLFVAAVVLIVLAGGAAAA